MTFSSGADCSDPRAIKRLIARFSDLEPAFSSLGAPFLVDADETRAVIACGAQALEPLLDALDSDDPKIVMYAAYCLGAIGGAETLEPLHRLVLAQESKVEKGPSDQAVLNAAAHASAEIRARLDRQAAASPADR